MSRLPRTSGKGMLRVLELAGFSLVHVRGSHHYLRKSGAAALVVVPVHGNRDLPIGTTKAVLRQAGLTGEDVMRLLRG